MSGSATFSSSSFTYAFTYDVFLSSDTRQGFTTNLYKALFDSGIYTFIDDEELQRGDEIRPSLVKAIEDSRIGIIIFSKNYAFSSSCLDELVKVMECSKKYYRLVWPVFYDVDPSDVLYQKGTYGEALTKHEEKFKEKVHEWRMALHQAASLSSWPFKLRDGHEHEFIGKIVKEVSNKINRIPLHVADHPVGLEHRVREVCSLLDVGPNDGIRMIGIYGMGGIGKTTLARAVFNVTADKFEGTCYLDNVRENSIKHGLVHLQERLLSVILGEKDIQLANVSLGISIIKQRLQHKRILLILDDVDKPEQLRALVGKSDWFGHGSKVIITTRDRHLLEIHGIERIYGVEVLNHEDALELFTWNAFKHGKVSPSYMKILNQAATYASGLPLALEVIGSNLFGKSMEYKRISNEQILMTLKVSYDALEEEEKSVFLDIVCCFKGYELTKIEDILRAHYGNHMKHHIRMLDGKSLISISSDGVVTLHPLIEEMGKNIVRKESPVEPGRCSRFRFSNDIIQVLQENTISKRVPETSVPEVLQTPLVAEVSHSVPEVLQTSQRGVPDVSLSHSVPEVLQTSKRALQAEIIWRLVGLASSAVGLLCFALSPSFHRLIRGWNTVKSFLYVLFSVIICVTVLCARRSSFLRQNVQLKAYLGFAVLMMISVYSYFYDKAVSGKPEILSLVSNAAFALMSLCLSKLIRFGFEMGIFGFFLGCFTIQLVTIDLKLILVAIIFGCPLFIMHSSSNFQPEIGNQCQDIHSSSDSRPLIGSQGQHVIDIHRGSMQDT